MTVDVFSRCIFRSSFDNILGVSVLVSVIVSVVVSLVVSVSVFDSSLLFDCPVSARDPGLGASGLVNFVR